MCLCPVEKVEGYSRLHRRRCKLCLVCGEAYYIDSRRGLVQIWKPRKREAAAL